MIRMALEDLGGVTGLRFDIPARKLEVFHSSDVAPIRAKLENLRLGAVLTGTSAFAGEAVPERKNEANVLRIALGINLFMFVAELSAGLAFQSTGLIADSLDMFADAAVYGVSLYAVGRAARTKLRAAHLSGWLQLVLALAAASEVARRAWFGSDPESLGMMGVAAVAFVANLITLMLLSRHREGGAHMKAGWIFTTNDVLANLGVIIAGALVWWTGAAWPDFVVGAAIAALVLSGAIRILRIRA